MPIVVVCPGCRKRFKVSDQFAGRTGPCPNCKQTIKIPKKGEEVKVHAPQEFAGGGKGRRGELLTKPIARRETQWNPVVAATIAGVSLVVVAVTWIAGPTLWEKSLIARAVGLLLVTPPLAIAGYWFLRDEDELEPHQGANLYARAVACSIFYVLLWWAYDYAADRFLTGELWSWAIVAPPFFIAGAMIALGAFDLDFGGGFLHFSFYILVTSVLQRIAGLGWPWEIPTGTLPMIGPP